MLEIEHLSKQFGKKEVLKDLNLKVGDGSIFGLIGVNGAGKSTLLRLIAGVEKPDEGFAMLNGRDTWIDPSIRRQIAYVSDEAYWRIGSRVDSMKSWYECFYDFDESLWQKYLKMFDLNPKAMMSTLSKGSKRRVSLTYALSIHADLILLDEAYDGLEPVARLKFKKALGELIEDEKVSVIIASHNLRELEDICDSYGILNNGVIQEYGDLLDARSNLNKYQLAFTDDKNPDDFSAFDVVHFEKEGRVCTLVIRGDSREIRTKLEAMHPLLIDVLPVSFEELFIYEVESRNEVYE